MTPKNTTVIQRQLIKTNTSSVSYSFLVEEFGSNYLMSVNRSRMRANLGYVHQLHAHTILVRECSCHDSIPHQAPHTGRPTLREPSRTTALNPWHLALASVEPGTSGLMPKAFPKSHKPSVSLDSEPLSQKLSSLREKEKIRGILVISNPTKPTGSTNLIPKPAINSGSVANRCPHYSAFSFTGDHIRRKIQE